LLMLALLLVFAAQLPEPAQKPEPSQPSGITGVAKLDCIVTDAGRLSNCVVLSESPASRGVGQAALDYTGTYQVTLGEGVNAFKPGSHFIRNMRVEMPTDEPKEAYADIRCHVTSEGKLEACVVLKESPANLGFGDAALKLSRSIKMKAVGSGGPGSDTYTTRIKFRLGD
jgi:TonB family protein